MIVNCNGCGKDFHKSPSKVHKTKNFCSNECRRLNLTNQVFDQLEVLEFEGMIGDKRKRATFKCKCSCGNIISVSGDHLSSGHSTQCRKCIGRQYCGEISGSYFSQLRDKARRRGKIFTITKEDIWEQFLKQDRKCIYSDLELTWQDGMDGERGTASVDRKDSKLGYIKENIQIVHKNVNRMKWDFTEEYFLDLCKSIANKGL